MVVRRPCLWADAKGHGFEAVRGGWCRGPPGALSPAGAYGQGCTGTADNRGRTPPPPPLWTPPQTKVAIMGKKETYNWEDLLGHF